MNFWRQPSKHDASEWGRAGGGGWWRGKPGGGGGDDYSRPLIMASVLPDSSRHTVCRICLNSDMRCGSDASVLYGEVEVALVGHICSVHEVEVALGGHRPIILYTKWKWPRWVIAQSEHPLI